MSNQMTRQPVRKATKSRGQRLLRLLTSIFDPRALAHGIKVHNYYNYTHVAELRQTRRGRAVSVSPTASFANGRNITIGSDVSIGANSYLWAGNGSARIVLGDHVLIAPAVMITAANYRFNDGSPITAQAMEEADVIIGSDVWIGYGAVILPGTRIGDGAIIGAGAIVRGEVAPRAIVANDPARVIGQRTAGAGDGEDAAPLPAAAAADPGLLALIRQETGCDAATLELPLDRSGIDSFDLVTLRTALESARGTAIPDRQWASIATLADIAALPALTGAAPAPTASAPAASARPPTQTTAPAAAPAPAQATAVPGHARRDYVLNMPQMALSGLSESWLFKEIGDLHWQLITEFLQTPSASIADEEGARLYATFTRLRIDVTPELRGLRENDAFAIEAALRRYGASMYFGEHTLTGPGAGLRATTMSTFARYGERGKNTSLIKGTPILPDPDSVPAETVLPEFAAEYRARRAKESGEVIFECDYDILAPHDINGVGLLYFAAYPMIFDLCLERHEGPGFLLNHGTVTKDILYYANAEPTERLRFRLHARESGDGLITHRASLARGSDGVRMAEALSVKRVSPPPLPPN